MSMMRLPALFEIKEIIGMTHGEPEKIGSLLYYGRKEICWVRIGVSTRFGEAFIRKVSAIEDS